MRQTLVHIAFEHSGDAYRVESIERLFTDGSRSRFGRRRRGR
jgi:hypothetical protein